MWHKLQKIEYFRTEHQNQKSAYYYFLTDHVAFPFHQNFPDPTKNYSEQTKNARAKIRHFENFFQNNEK